MTTETGNATLFAKMAIVMGAVRTLKREGRNTFDKYDYMTADTISLHIGELMAANGIVFLPSIISAETSEYATKSGSTNYRTVIQMQITFGCAESGATFTTLWFGEAIDRSDKSISKAAVSAVKYALAKTFLLSGGDDDADADSPVVETRKAAPVEDDLWETPAAHAKKPDTVSPASLTRITTLGVDVYGKDFVAQSDKLAEWASQGARKTLAELKVAEGEKLIRSLEKKLKESHAYPQRGRPLSKQKRRR